MIVLRAGSHFDISISTNINISTRKIRKIGVNRGYISIYMSVGISIGKNSIPYAYAYAYAYAYVAADCDQQTIAVITVISGLTHKRSESCLY